jgi:hypothetical protein
MKVIDTVLPEPKTESEAYNRWENRLASEMISQVTGKKIEVKYIPKISDKDCPPTSRGRKNCEAEGRHTWFNHAMDKAY